MENTVVNYKIKLMIDRNKSNDKFYYELNGEFKISHSGLINFLANNGFAKVIEGKQVKLVRVNNNLINEVMEVEISDFILNFLVRHRLPKVQLVFLRGINNYTSKKLLHALPTLDIEYPKDTNDTALFYYKNAVVKVVKGKIEKVKYDKVKNPIWEDLVINHSVHLEPYQTSQFEKFIFNLSKQDKERFNSLKSIIGYLLHNYQDPSIARAVILVDESISNDGSANGGTGKSLLAQALSKLRTVLTIDGKNLKNNSRFFFQQVERTTNIICYDDVRRDFDFEMLYSSITSGINVEKKFQNEFSISFKESPKLLISSNYAVIGTGGNTDFRRRIEFEIADYYNSNRTPIDEFGNRFFDEWSYKEWNNFYLFMMSCTQFYLTTGLIFPKSINLKRNKLEQITDSEFLEFMDTMIEPDTRIDKRKFYNDFLIYSSKADHSQHIFTKWLKQYALYNNLVYSDKSSNGNYYFTLSTKK